MPPLYFTGEDKTEYSIHRGWSSKTNGIVGDKKPWICLSREKNIEYFKEFKRSDFL